MPRLWRFKRFCYPCEIEMIPWLAYSYFQFFQINIKTKAFCMPSLSLVVWNTEAFYFNLHIIIIHYKVDEETDADEVIMLELNSRKQKLQNIKWESHLQLLRHKMGKLQWWWVFVVVLLVTLINTKGKSDSCKREVFRSRSSAVLLLNWLENVHIFALVLVEMGYVLFHSFKSHSQFNPF